ncbi:MAG TPA: hypothetical protein VLF20_02755 [Patescibacteria group bacterium]|nr:hypothetical protein [Patescibacteria group bacterium]
MPKHNHFYHHIVIIDSIHIGLDSLELEPHEKEELAMLAENNLHHTIMDTVLSELEEGDKKVFLALVLHNNHNEIWKLLSFKVRDAEEKIKKTAEKFIKQLHDDIKEAHTKK